MRYKVHQFELRMSKDREKLEDYLNSLSGEVVAVVNNVKPTFQGMGATAKVDFLFIVERLN